MDANGARQFRRTADLHAIVDAAGTFSRRDFFEPTREQQPFNEARILSATHLMRAVSILSPPPTSQAHQVGAPNNQRPAWAFSRDLARAETSNSSFDSSCMSCRRVALFNR
jgi:hypothetical protein